MKRLFAVMLALTLTLALGAAAAKNPVASFTVNADGTLAENGLKNVTNDVEGSVNVAAAPDGTMALTLINGSAGSYVYFVVEAFDASKGSYTVEVDYYDNQSIALQAWAGEFTDGGVIGTDRQGGENDGEWQTLSFTFPDRFINRIGGGTGDFRYAPGDGYDSSDASRALFIKEVRIVEAKYAVAEPTAPATVPTEMIPETAPATVPTETTPETAPATVPAETTPASTTLIIVGISVLVLVGAGVVLAMRASKKRK